LRLWLTIGTEALCSGTILGYFDNEVSLSNESFDAVSELREGLEIALLAAKKGDGGLIGRIKDPVIRVLLAARVQEMAGGSILHWGVSLRIAVVA
jgi:hypothetical protein